ncbi:TetR/AcrR family transcriptional regulator [Capillibacterium thermochitinicola]|uniref:TetR/AcrR family transcriptional regulator n=1 Tax=Capillibacterium thermochitinicola TaxID=2699427 RepID=A0A8J6LS32_9FIRM|nr:TetR/AcrR family transcriptional regulator [Capillibacterium thermochitinicola]MBA2132932.1 TetR/AcrR family transcriptional regulator [Capillibacterium thermochitinicola]
MPKDTFFNLPKEKQERIIEAAIDEFATHPFHQARVTVIAEQAGIAVGSFYQYFEDKKDLYKYLMGLLVEKKLSYINSDMVKNKDKYDFFQLLREVYLSGFRFAKENPRLLPIGLMLANDKELYREIFGEYEDQSAEFFQQLLEYGQVQGAIDPAINPKIMGKMLTGMLYSLTDFIMEDGKFDLDDMKIIDQMLYFIENGLRKK